MNIAYHIRDEVRSTYIRSTLIAKGEEFHLIERPWLDNQTNISCIPAGEYHCTFLERSASGKYKNIYHIQNVPGRIGVLIHNGNLAIQSKACPLIGKRRGRLAGKPAVLNSLTALYEFVELMEREDFILKIIGEQHGITT
jgi:hypothetical protein